MALTWIAAAAEPAVTATRRVEKDGRMITVRQINGRWWAPDQREVYRTSTSWLWTIAGGNAQHLVRFDHHRPLDRARVAALDRSMGPDEVRAILGPPNRVFPSDEPENAQHWDYFAADGYQLTVFFARHGGIFVAHESLASGQVKRPIARLGPSR